MNYQPDRKALSSAAQHAVYRINRGKDGDTRAPSVPVATLAERFQQGYQGQHGRVSIEELTSATCRWPFDQRKGPVKFCGDTVQIGSSYCSHHRERSLGRWS